MNRENGPKGKGWRLAMATWGVGGFRLGRLLAGVACVVAGVGGCSLERAVDVDDPELQQVKDPNYMTTRVGAVALYYGVINALKSAMNERSQRVGVMTDELASTVTYGFWPQGDSRTETASGRFVYGLDVVSEYGQLHNVRLMASQARVVLQRLQDSTLAGLIAGAYALEGYSILALAEDFCSGVPLSEATFDGEVVYGEARSTTQLLTVAIALFDSALTIPHDSVAIATLARVGLGRAYLALGEFEKAAQAVSALQPTDTFRLTYTAATNPTTGFSSSFWTTPGTNGNSENVELLNQEGSNGMVWYSDPAHLDPRVPVTTTLVNGVRTFPAIVRQQKFVTGTVTFPVARWIDAQMIQAEAALQRDDPAWVTWLNAARATKGLDTLDDPGTRAARVDLLFRERAFWFYLEGQRLADFRRLVRQYGREPNTVYPTGLYGRSSYAVYGSAMVFVVPAAEMDNNYRYNGCLNKQP